MKVRDLPTGRIKPGNNDRTRFDETSILALAMSIDQDGLLSPILVHTNPDCGTERNIDWQIVAGERRWRAVTHLGWPTIPAFVIPADPARAARIMLTENLVREQLNPMDEARALQARLDQGVPAKDLAKDIGRSVTDVVERASLTGLSPESQHLIATGELTVARARHMVGLNSDYQLNVLKALGESELTTRQFMLLCDKVRQEQDQASMFDPDQFLVVQTWAKKQRGHGPLTVARIALREGAVKARDAGFDSLADDLLEAYEETYKR